MLCPHHSIYSLNQLYGAAGLQVDNRRFVYIAGAFNVLLDERRSSLDAVDSLNTRIQTFPLDGSGPRNGTTVAGGNGLGTASNQFNVFH